MLKPCHAVLLSMWFVWLFCVGLQRMWKGVVAAWLTIVCRNGAYVCYFKVYKQFSWRFWCVTMTWRHVLRYKIRRSFRWNPVFCRTDSVVACAGSCQLQILTFAVRRFLQQWDGDMRWTNGRTHKYAWHCFGAWLLSCPNVHECAFPAYILI